jgi:fructose-1,6-bisphosphatase/inositol monophosphatase family enzyme
LLNDIEKKCLRDYRNGNEATVDLGGDELGHWVTFGIRLLLDAGRIVREGRDGLTESAVDYKEDGSPATRLEAEIEHLLRDRLVKLDPQAVVVGEETGGTLTSSGTAVAMDPIDGTWAFLSGLSTWTTTLAVFKDGKPILGMVSNPTTGEIGYATSNNSRLVRLSVFGEDDTAWMLPLRRVTDGAVLVNVHPNREARGLVHTLYDAWQNDQVRMVRSPGGSPSWALLEAAKGDFAYTNMWSKGPTAAYDLAAGVMLVEGAGGRVVSLDGNPINGLNHQGPFVAAIDKSAQRIVVEIVRGAMHNC